MTPVVSVVVPCYKQAQYLPETLDSILRQTYSNWECIIVNDGSPDNTEEIAKKYCEMDCRFRYVYKDNGGISEARNTGIRGALGEYILPLDSDDIIADTYLEKSVDRFTHYPETKLVYCKADMFGAINEMWELGHYDYDRLLYSNHIFCSCVFRKCDYDRTTGYNKNMVCGWEDWDFLLSLLNSEDVVFQIDEVLFHYRIKDKSRSTCADNHLNEMASQLIYNHIDLYKDKLYLIMMGSAIDAQNKKLRQELENVHNSKAYRLGKLLLKPFAIFKK